MLLNLISGELLRSIWIAYFWLSVITGGNVALLGGFNLGRITQKNFMPWLLKDIGGML
jgi:hypothetical protein